MFVYYNNKICVEGGWLVEAEIVTKSNYDKLRNSVFKEERRGCYRRTALILWDSIPDRFRKVIVEKYGNPQDHIRKNTFENYIEYDNAASAFFRAYKLEDGKGLPEETIKVYTGNASILKSIDKLLTERLLLRKALNGSSRNVWTNIVKEIETLDCEKWPNTLPVNERRLKDKYNQFKNEGYSCLVHANFCNSHSEKLNEKSKLWLVAMWANQVNKVTGIQHLFDEYNKRARNEGWKELKNKSTIYNFINREDVKELWYGHRYGELKAKEKYAYQHKTKLPTMRDSLWYSDGTKMNYYFIDDNGNTSTCQVL